MDLTEMIQLKVQADYSWDDPGVIRIGKKGDVAAYLSGDCSGRSLIFCHGNGESAISGASWFDELSKSGTSVICPDYRGYGLSEGEFSEEGCYEVAHAAYDFLVKEKGTRCEDVFVSGYSLGSAVAVELASTETIGGLILETPFLNGEELKRFWLTHEETPEDDEVEKRFPTSSRLPNIRVPTLVIHGTSDDVVPFSQGKAVYDLLASRNKTFIPVRGAGHADFKARLGFSYIPILQNFISPMVPNDDHADSDAAND